MEKLFSYIRNHYIPMVKEEIEDYCAQKSIRPFWETLDVFLLKKHMTKRQLSSKLKTRNTIYNIYNDANFVPSKRICILLGICLQLEKGEFDEFLNEAGYHLSNHIKSDVVIMFCIENKIYSLERMDLYLEKVGEKPLYSCYF